jgi:hypothetical protein
MHREAPSRLVSLFNVCDWNRALAAGARTRSAPFSSQLENPVSQQPNAFDIRPSAINSSRT